MAYSRSIRIEFSHCDPAGIVFYPRYLEFANHMMENFFADVVGHSYAQIVGAGDGVPAVHLDCNFRAPSRLGDRLDVMLRVTAIGRSSLDLDISGRGAGEAEPRFTIVKRAVFVDGRAMKSSPWPGPVRARLEAAMKEDSA